MVVAAIACISTPLATALSRGDGLLVYGESTLTTPRYTNWIQSLQLVNGESSAPAAAATIRHSTIKASPTRNEAISGYQTTGGTLYIQLWNGSSWSSQWNVSVGNGSLPRFDIAYEQASGDAVVMYSTNTATTNELAYRVWNGTSWTSASTYDAQRTSGIVDSIKLADREGSNDIAVAWGDRNFDLSANAWNGSTNSWISEPAAALSSNLAKVSTATSLTNQSYDIAYEQSTGELLVAWGDDAVLDLSYATRAAGSGGTWASTVVATAFFEEPTDIALAAEPGTAYIAYANATDNGADADAGIWNGSAWVNLSNFDTAIDTVAAGTSGIAVTWVSAGGQSRAVVTYDDANAAGIDWLFYNKNTATWSALQTDFITAPAPSNVDDKMHRLRANPHNAAEAMLLVVDSNSDLFAKKLAFDGTTLTWASVEPGAVALETSVSAITGYAADFAYNDYAPIGTLGIDIVNGSGTSVVSPAVAFSAAAPSFSCQTTTAVLGTSSERIRITNGTTTPGWTLSVAATNGNTSQWQSGAKQYDFNDQSGAPAGCPDGVDGDTSAGLLSVNPSTGSIGAQTTCLPNGLSLGSSVSFNQSVTDNATLLSASSSSQLGCYWDLTNVALSQMIPPEQPQGVYALSLTVTVVAN